MGWLFQVLTGLVDEADVEKRGGGRAFADPHEVEE